MIKGERVELAELRVETAPPNSPERGKVCIAAWDSTPSEQREDVKVRRARAPKYVDTTKNRRQRFLTWNAVDSIRAHTSQPGNAQLELVFLDDEVINTP
jgi:hypothetical protein